MDKMVIILIAAGVCCAVAGTVMFLCLMLKGNGKKEEAGSPMDPDYADNFKECFSNTGNIEETLEQLADIYSDNQYMLKLVSTALDYIRDGHGDYETALDGINVDGDAGIARIHAKAIKQTFLDDEEEESQPREIPKEKKKKPRPAEEEFEEDFEEDVEEEASEEEVPEEEEEEEKPKSIKKKKKRPDSDGKKGFKI